MSSAKSTSGVQVRRPEAESNVRVGLADVARSFTDHTELVYQMTQRAVAGRYRGSVLGMAWSLCSPILMLAVYTFVFGVVFKMRGIGTGDATGGFAVWLFAGLICHQFFAECLNRAPMLVVGNVQYVKKVVFPLHSLPWIAVGAALFQAMMSLTVLVVFNLIVSGELNWTLLFIPVVILPLALLSAGIVWIVAALSVYVRDIGQVMGVFTTALLFLSPVFYQVEQLPASAQKLIYLNPLTAIITQLRKVVLHGELPDFLVLGVYSVVALFVAWFGLRLFTRMRGGFADVL